MHTRSSVFWSTSHTSYFTLLHEFTCNESLFFHLHHFFICSIVCSDSMKSHSILKDSKTFSFFVSSFSNFSDTPEQHIVELWLLVSINYPIWLYPVFNHPVDIHETMSTVHIICMLAVLAWPQQILAWHRNWPNSVTSVDFLSVTE